MMVVVMVMVVFIGDVVVARTVFMVGVCCGGYDCGDAAYNDVCECGSNGFDCGCGYNIDCLW